MTHDHEEKVMEELIEMYVAPNRQDTVKECVVGKAEYQGTVRINASAIPLFRKVQSALRSNTALVEAETVEKCARVAAELPYNPEHEKRIKQILVEGQGWIYAEQQIEHHNDPKQPYGTYRTERNPIEIFQVNGEMASVNWYRQGNREYNGKFVVVVEYFDGV